MVYKPRMFILLNMITHLRAYRTYHRAKPLLLPNGYLYFVIGYLGQKDVGE